MQGLFKVELLHCSNYIVYTSLCRLSTNIPTACRRSHIVALNMHPKGSVVKNPVTIEPHMDARQVPWKGSISAEIAGFKVIIIRFYYYIVTLLSFITRNVLQPSRQNRCKCRAASHPSFSVRDCPVNLPFNPVIIMWFEDNSPTIWNCLLCKRKQNYFLCLE